MAALAAMSHTYPAMEEQRPSRRPIAWPGAQGSSDGAPILDAFRKGALVAAMMRAYPGITIEEAEELIGFFGLGPRRQSLCDTDCTPGDPS
jgi:hypothetical protein